MQNNWQLQIAVFINSEYVFRVIYSFIVYLKKSLFDFRGRIFYNLKLVYIILRVRKETSFSQNIFAYVGFDRAYPVLVHSPSPLKTG